MHRLLTVTGPDRPGIVAALAGVLAQQGVDIEDVSMTRLHGNFAMILLAHGGEEARLRPALRAVGEEMGLVVHLEPAVEGPDEEANGFVFAVGPNRVGIVAALSAALAAHRANITEMATRLLEHTEVPVYLVRIEVTIPPTTWPLLEAELKAVGEQLGVEVRLEPLERVDL